MKATEQAVIRAARDFLRAYELQVENREPGPFAGLSPRMLDVARKLRDAARQLDTTCGAPVFGKIDGTEMVTCARRLGHEGHHQIAGHTDDLPPDEITSPEDMARRYGGSPDDYRYLRRWSARADEAVAITSPEQAARPATK